MSDLMISPPKTSPADAGTNALLAGGMRWLELSVSIKEPTGLMGGSSLNTTLTPWMPNRRSFFLIILAKGSMRVWEISLTRKAVGSNLLAAPIQLIMGMPAFLHWMMMSILAEMVSIQSAT